ncbi:MAG: flagellar hook-basal body complex protein FliE [Desulfobulbaceae bacterium]|nr:flagellar hook-basal body complex protein FliE [Candidatus Kapabacteria bacterium]MBS4000061.1 flagellar hook-basal body complex protein FliE [Desulfobulbaceae bacterium]
MIINEIKKDGEFLPLTWQKEVAQPAPASGTKFSDTLKEMITDVNHLQKESGEMTERLIKGEPVEIHDVMIASQKARTAFQLLLELRNKGLDLYREVNRMQV